MFLAIVVLTLQLGAEDGFSKLVREISRVASEHSTAISTSKSVTGKDAIAGKNNERIQVLATEAMEERMSFEYLIQSLDRNADGDYSVVLEPSEPIAKADFVKRRSLTLPIQNELGETLFTGDLLAFSGKLKTGASPRTKKAIPFALVRPEGLKQMAIWIDEIEIGEAKPKTKEEKEPVSNVVTPKMFITEIDRVFKEARTEFARGKTTADKQDIADKNAAIVLDAVQKFDGQIFVFETLIHDVVRTDREKELKVILIHSEPYKSFASYDRTPLHIFESLSLTIVEEDRNDFTIGRKLFITAKISISKLDLGNRNSEEDFGFVVVNKKWIASNTVVVTERQLFFRLEDIKTEFMPDKSEPKRKTK